MTLYKVTGPDGLPCHGGSDAWSLPKNGIPGAWRKVKGELEPCKNGLHLCEAKHLIDWLGPVIWEAETRGDRIDQTNKVVVREARLIRQCEWNEQIERLFAADCAERVLHIANDKRCDDAVLAARQFAFGFIDDAASAAARDAASAAARDDEREWQNNRLIEYLTGKVDIGAIRKSVEKTDGTS